VMSRRLFGDFLVGDSYEEIPLERNAYLLDVLQLCNRAEGRGR